MTHDQLNLFDQPPLPREDTPVTTPYPSEIELAERREDILTANAGFSPGRARAESGRLALEGPRVVEGYEVGSERRPLATPPPRRYPYRHGVNRGGLPVTQGGSVDFSRVSTRLKRAGDEPPEHIRRS